MNFNTLRYWIRPRFPGIEQAVEDHHLLSIKRTFKTRYHIIGQLFEINAYNQNPVSFRRPAAVTGTEHIVQGETVYEVLQKLSNSYDDENQPIKLRTPEDIAHDYLEQIILQGAQLETFCPPKGRGVTSLIIDRDGSIMDHMAWPTFGKCYRAYRHKTVIR